MRSFLRKLAASVAIVSVAGQSVAEDLYFYRHLSPESQFQAVDRPAPPPLGQNTVVVGTGDLGVYAATSARARPGLLFNFPVTAPTAQGTVAWRVVAGSLPPGLSLAGNGIVSGAPSATGTFGGIEVEGRDAAGKAGRTQPFSITVVDRPSIGMEAAYSYASGAPARIEPKVANVLGSSSWSLSGSLPLGMSLDSATGAIAGSSDQAGLYEGLALTVVDSDGAVGRSAAFSVEVASAMRVAGIQGSYAARLNVPMQDIRPNLSGAANPVTWSLASGELPSGLSLNRGTGAVTGSPTKAGVARDLALRATDTVTGATVSSPTFSLAVGNAPVVTLAKSEYFVRVGNGLSVSPTVVGLLGRGRWFLDGGAVPPGTTLSSTSGSISGMVGGGAVGTAGGLTLRVIDLYDGSTASSSPFSVTALARPAISGLRDIVAEIGIPLSAAAPAASNIVGIARWSISGGLPKGLSFDPATGVISGTPTETTQVAPTLDIGVVDDFDNSGPLNPTRLRVSVVPKGTVTVGGFDPAYTAFVGKPFTIQPTSTGGGISPYWSASVLPSWLGLDTRTGRLSGTPAAPEESGPLTLTLENDKRQSATTTPFKVDAVSALTLAYGPVATTTGSPVSAVPAVGGAVGATAFTLSGTLPPGISFDGTTGAFSGTTFQAGIFRVRVVARDSRTASDPADIAVQVTGTEWSASMPAVPAGRPGAPFSATPASSGFPSTPTWSLASGTLPAWARLDAATGTISGTPPEVGYYGPLALDAVAATGERARTGAFNISITVDPVLVAGASDAKATLGAPFEMTASSANSDGPVRWSLNYGTLPPGLALDGDAGKVAGVPTQVGNYPNIVLLAVDRSGAGARTRPFAISVAGAVLSVPNVPNLAGTVGTALDMKPLTVDGAVGAVSFGLGAGTLPAWASVDPATGVIRGIPAGAASVRRTDGLRIQAVDSLGNARLTAPFSIAIARAELAATPGTDLVTHPGYAASGGKPAVLNALGTVTWTSKDAPPAGLALDPATGRLAGTATAAPGAYQVALTATDGFDNVAAVTSATVTVLPAPTVAVAESYRARENFDFGFTASADSVIPPLTWSVASGTLPAGLVLNAATGRVSGAAKAVGTTNGLSIKVTDAQGASGTSTPFAITVTDHAEASMERSTYGGRVGLPMSTQAPLVSGAVGAVSFSLASGTLPDGLAVDPATGAVKGTTQAAGSYRISVAATDATGTPAATPPFTVSITPVPVPYLADAEIRAGAPFVAQATAQYGMGGQRQAFFSISSGTLPKGIGLDGLRGTLKGTPDTPGTYAAAISYSDGQGVVGTAPFVITVKQGLGISGLLASYPGRAGADLQPAVTPTLTGAKGTVTWEASGFPAGLTLDGNTGAVTGKPAGGFAGTGTLLATDAFDGATASAPVRLAIAPPLSVSTPTGFTTHPGYAAAASAPSVVGQRGGGLTWSSVGSALPGWASVDPATGIVRSDDPRGPSASGVVLRAQDGLDGATADTGAFALNIVPMPSVSNVSTSYVARFGFPYASVPPTLDNAIGGVRWSLGSGTLPAWATLNPDGSISGQYPDVVGTAPDLTLVGTDATGASARSVAFSLGVYAQPAVSLAASPAKDRLRAGDNYVLTPSTQGLVGAPGWDVSYRNGATALLPGLGMADRATGVVSGTVTGAGDTSFALRLTDSSDGTTAFSSVVALASKPALAMSAVPSYAVHANRTFIRSPAPTPPGLTGNATYALKPANLPEGMSFGGDAPGVLSGVPATVLPETQYTVTVKDSWDQREASTTFTLQVLPDIAFSGAVADATGVIGQSLTVPAPGVSNPAGAVAWTLKQGSADVTDTFGTACPGLGFSRSTGAISGTPTTVCTANSLAVTATDADSASVTSGLFTVKVRSAIAVAQQPASVTVFKGASANITASVKDAFGAVTWDFVGTVPTWLTKGACSGSSCALVAAPPKGVPSGIYPSTGAFALKATDASGSTVTTEGFTVNATQVAVVVTAGASTTYTVRTGTALTTSAFSVSGGTAPYVWAVQTVSGTAPASVVVTPSAVNNQANPQQTATVAFTPSQVGPWVFKLRATSGDDATNSAESAEITANVTQGIVASVADMTVHSGAGGSWGSSFGTTFADASTQYAKGAVTYAVSGLSWISLSSPGSNRVVANTSGQNPSPGAYTYTLTATDKGDNTQITTTGKVTVLAVPSVTSSISGTKKLYVRKGVPVPGVQVTMSPLIGSPTWAVTTGPVQSGGSGLPASGCSQVTSFAAGLSLSSTGVIGGTLTATPASEGASLSGTYGYCYKGTDVDGSHAGDYVYVYAATGPLALTGVPAAVTLTQGYSYTGTLTAASSVSNPTWATTGTLPAGLTKTSTGKTFTISGTPTGTLGGTYTVTATDTWDGATTSQTITFSGATPFAMTTPANSTTRVSALFASPAPSATGGTAPYAWSLAPGSAALPAWATLNASTGVISGRPTGTQAATGYKLRATDANGTVTDTGAFTVAVTANNVALTAPAPGAALKFHVNATKTIQAASTGTANPSYLAQYNNGTSTLGTAWPAWISVSPSGLVTASPSAATGTAGYNLFAVDGVDSAYVQSAYSFQAVAPLAFTTQPTSLAAVTSSAITGTTPVVGNGIGAVTYALTYQGTDISGALNSASYCPGLSFSTTTGVISGTPTAACSLSGANVVATDAWDGTAVTSNGVNVVVTQSSIAVSGLPAEARATKAFTGTATTSLSSPVWTAASSPAGMGATVSGTTLTSTAPSPAAKTNYTLTMTAKQGTAYTLTASPVVVTVWPKLTETMAALAKTAGSTLSVAPTVNAAARVGTLSYTLTAGGTTSDTALASCGIAFDPATGTLSSSALKMCSLTSATIAVSDDGGGNAPLADSASATFSLSITSPYAIAAQPYTFTSQQNSTTATSTTVSGTPVGSLTWQVVEASNPSNPVPGWLSLTNCTNASCAVSASPTDADATGTYPAAGGYRLVATDENGTTVNTGTFTVIVVGTQSLSNTRPAYVWSANGQPGACDVGVAGCGQQNVASYWPSGGGALYAYNASATNIQYQWASAVTVTKVTISLQAGTYCGRNGGESSYFFMDVWNETTRSWGTFWSKGLGPWMDRAVTYTEGLAAPVTGKKFRVSMSCSNPNGADFWSNWRLGDTNGFAP